MHKFGPFFFLMDGNGDPIPCEVDGPESMIAHARAWSAQNHRKTVAKERVGDAEVSTVFLFIGNTRGFTDPEPCAFETRVFGGRFDGYTGRWASRAEAQAGHAAIVTWLQTGLPPTEGHDDPA